MREGAQVFGRQACSSCFHRRESRGWHLGGAADAFGYALNEGALVTIFDEAGVGPVGVIGQVEAFARLDEERHLLAAGD